MALIPLKLDMKGYAGDARLNTDTNQIEVYSDGVYKGILSDLGVATDSSSGLMSKEDKTFSNELFSELTASYFEWDYNNPSTSLITGEGL